MVLLYDSQRHSSCKCEERRCRAPRWALQNPVLFARASLIVRAQVDTLQTRTRENLSSPVNLPFVADTRVNGTKMETTTHVAINKRKALEDREADGTSGIVTSPATSSSAIVHGRASTSPSTVTNSVSAPFTNTSISSSVASGTTLTA